MSQWPLSGELLQAAPVKGLIDLGQPEAKLRTIVDPQVVSTVDEAKLADMISAGRVHLYSSGPLKLPKRGLLRLTHPRSLGLVEPGKVND